MPACARRQIVVEEEVGVYHCIARCVRRALLCGIDPYTGQDFSHRKDWIVDRMRELAVLFAIEVCDYSVMSNHLHLVLRIRPDIAGQWSDDEIALRWCRVFLACSVYVDLNPIRAGLATTPEESPYTSGRFCDRTLSMHATPTELNYSP